MYMYGDPSVAALAPSDPNGPLVVLRPAPTPTAPLFFFFNGHGIKWPKSNVYR